MYNLFLMGLIYYKVVGCWLWIVGFRCSLGFSFRIIVRKKSRTNILTKIQFI